MGLRITVLIGAFALLYGALGFKMYDLQLRQGEALSAKAASIHELAGKLAPKRGSIYFTDKDGGRIQAAINKDYPSIYAVPKEITDPAQAASILDGIIGRSESELVRILS